jgi:hypothetical protein
VPWGQWVPCAITVWNGTAAEATELARVITNNCACGPSTRCGAHTAILDQRFLDGLLFGRHLLPQLRRQEMRRSRKTAPT